MPSYTQRTLQHSSVEAKVAAEDACIYLYIYYTPTCQPIFMPRQFNACFFKTQKDNGQDILGLKKLQHLPTTLPPA